MWCPVCKTEYVKGITKCADCGIDLVEELPAASGREMALSPETRDKLERLRAREDSRDTIEPETGSTRYIDKRSRYEEMKSSAYTFLVIGTLGLVLMLLVGLGVIPLHMASYMKIIMAVVMGALFLLFLVIGVRSLKNMKVLQTEADEEEALTEKILSRFFDEADADAVDASLPPAETGETLYFYRSERIKDMLVKEYPDLAGDYTDVLVEKIYAQLFPDS